MIVVGTGSAISTVRNVLFPALLGIEVFVCKGDAATQAPKTSEVREFWTTALVLSLAPSKVPTKAG